MWQIISGTPLRILLIHRWNSSGALQIPNGNLLKQYLPNGVKKVVKGLDSGSKEICQKPLFASSFENTLAPANCARVVG